MVILKKRSRVGKKPRSPFRLSRKEESAIRNLSSEAIRQISAERTRWIAPTEKEIPPKEQIAKWEQVDKGIRTLPKGAAEAMSRHPKFGRTEQVYYKRVGEAGVIVPNTNEENSTKYSAGHLRRNFFGMKSSIHTHPTGILHFAKNNGPSADDLLNVCNEFMHHNGQNLKNSHILAVNWRRKPVGYFTIHVSPKFRRNMIEREEFMRAIYFLHIANESLFSVGYYERRALEILEHAGLRIRWTPFKKKK